jgi:hypothetical protein
MIDIVILFLREAAMPCLRIEPCRAGKSRDRRQERDSSRRGFVDSLQVVSLMCAAAKISMVFGSLLVCNLATGQVPTRPVRPGDSSLPKEKQASLKKTAAINTVIDFELLQAEGGGGLHGQQWLKVLEPLDVSLRVRKPILGDKPEMKEREAGKTRYVTAIGTLDRSGNLIFPDRTFAPSDATKLKEWINELRTYGIKGTPVGKSLWGLSEEQFATLFDGLLKKVEFETENLPLKQAVTKLPLPSEFPLRWNSDAVEKLAKLGDKARVRQELKGFSAALALALTLSDNGFGFRPNRTPSGVIELLIEPRNSKLEQWPIGWPVQRATFKAAPKLYAMVPIELSDVELSDVLIAISELAETPILIDYAELDAKQIDLEKVKVSFPRKMTTWSLALRQMVIPKRLTRELWQDEAGRVFVWITTTRAGRAKDE